MESATPSDKDSDNESKFNNNVVNLCSVKPQIFRARGDWAKWPG